MIGSTVSGRSMDPARFDPEKDGISAWRPVDIGEHAERAHGVRYGAWGKSRLIKRLGLSRQKAWPRRLRLHQGPRAKLAAAHPGERLEIWRQDEVGAGQNGPYLPSLLPAWDACVRPGRQVAREPLPAYCLPTRTRRGHLTCRRRPPGR
jgi:hypothetical protein